MDGRFVFLREISFFFNLSSRSVVRIARRSKGVSIAFGENAALFSICH